MTRINVFRNVAAPREFVAWGKNLNLKNISPNLWGNINALAFGAALILCSLAVGCSSEKPKAISSNIQIPVAQPQIPATTNTTSSLPAEKKPAPKKIVHKKPATVNYTDKTYGVSFEYPRRYAIETGNAATDLLTSSPVPMNFVQPGGVALAAVELPETSFVNTDFSSAFFNVSVHKNLTADQCNEFAVPQPKLVAETTTASNDATSVQSAASSDTKAMTASSQTQSTASQPVSTPAVTQPLQEEQKGSKLMLGDLELRATEAVSGEGTRQSDAKYFHVFQNGACYEFALKVTTVASEDGLIKHVDRDKVFDRLEKILSTVKINPVTPEVTAETPAPVAPGTPAQ